MSDTVTRGIRVKVRSTYVPERSVPQQKHYFFSYHIRISNEGRETAQLLSRHWIITDAGHRIQEVRGLGVVGQQPMLKPGESFEYTSWASIATPGGTMHGTYEMRAEDGHTFEAAIPSFTLSVPRTLH